MDNELNEQAVWARVTGASGKHPKPPGGVKPPEPPEFLETLQTLLRETDQLISCYRRLFAATGSPAFWQGRTGAEQQRRSLEKLSEQLGQTPMPVDQPKPGPKEPVRRVEEQLRRMERQCGEELRRLRRQVPRELVGEVERLIRRSRQRLWMLQRMLGRRG